MNAQPWIITQKLAPETPKGTAGETIKKKTRRTKVKPVIHPLLEQCSKVCSNNFWMDLLDKASRGKFPSGFQYQPGVLTYRKRSKSTFITLPEQVSLAEITPVLHSILDFFRENGIVSPEDQEIEAQHFEEYIWTNENLAPFTPRWDQVSNQAARDLLFTYSRNVGRALSLTPEQMDQLYGILISALGMRILDNDRVKLSVIQEPGARVSCSREHGIQILNIEGIVWNEENHLFMIDPSMMPEDDPPQYIIPKTSRKNTDETRKYVRDFVRNFARDLGRQREESGSGDSGGDYTRGSGY